MARQSLPHGSEMLRICTLISALFLQSSLAVYSYTDLIQDSVQEEETFLNPSDFENVDNFQEVNLKTIFGPTARSLGRSSSGIDLNVDPLLRARKFEGDIAGLNSSTIHRFVNDSNRLQRNAVLAQWKLWPEGQIPYMLSSKYGDYSRKIIAKAMQEYTTKTCIRFKPRDQERDYIFIYPDDGCYSLVGRVGGKQPVSLDAGCIQVGTVVHELMHTTGFFHEQSRADRDEYIDIQWQNVDADAQDQFEKYSLRTIQHLGVDYDYGSIMHYGPLAFSRNGRKTIIAKKSGGDRMGQRIGFSQTDIAKVNKLYQCESRTGHSTEDGDENAVLGPTRAPPVTFRPEEVPTTDRRPWRPVTPDSGSTTCADKSWRCRLYRLFGYCDQARYQQECPVTCGTCDRVVVTSRATLRPRLYTSTRAPSTDSGDDDDDSQSSVQPPSACSDKNDHCGKWARSGQCTKTGFRNYMVLTCPRSCNACPTAASETSSGETAASNCQDQNGRCGYYASLGRCDGGGRTGADMQRYCPRSCGKC